MNLFDYKEMLEGKPVHVATVTHAGNSNLFLARGTSVVEAYKLELEIGDVETMRRNIRINPRVVMAVLDDDGEGVRITGTACFPDDATFVVRGKADDRATLVVKASKVEEYR